MSPIVVVSEIDSLLPDAGREQALDLDALYRAHGAAVSRWVKRLWGRQDAEDVLHEVFLVVQRLLPEFRGDAALSTWLYTITTRVVSNRRRKERWRRLLFARAVPELQVERSSIETPLAGALRDQTAGIVYATLDELSERDRTLLIMFELEGLPIAEIMAVLSISEDNAWVSLHRARARFRKAYVKRFGREMGA
ncbi:MAG TPA: sigma-70 family RNA polymerase sigma factor [Polyangiaceae bacterium]|nr:sigma-70 family RNA polymerase sigma factor [Polyangiaceae bacterium]